MTGPGDDQAGWAAPGQGGNGPAGTPPDPASWSWPTDTPATPTAAVPPSPYAAAGAPRQPRKRGWLVVLLGALLLILVMAVVGTILFASRSYPPYATARDFLNDFGGGHTQAAETRLCAADRAEPVRILQLLRAATHESDAKTFAANALGVDRSGSTATVKFTVTYNSGRSSTTFDLPMREENGSWKVCLSGA